MNMKSNNWWLVSLGTAIILAIVGILNTAHPVRAVVPDDFTSQVYQDADGNGQVDRLVVVINGGEDLTTCTVTAGEILTDWTYTGNDIGGTLASATCSLTSETITFVITGATAGITGHSSAPTIAYDNDDGDNSIANASGNLGTVAADNVIDDANPVLVSAAFGDDVVNGSIDIINVIWSEGVIVSGSTAADWTIVGGDVNAVFSSAVDDPVGGISQEVIVTADANETSASSKPTIAYDNDDANNSVVDEASNIAGTSAAVTTTDAAAPYLISATYSDSDGSGKVDRITLVFSESTTFTYATADWAFTTAGDVTLAADFAAADCTTGSATIVCTDANNSDLTAAANKTGLQAAAGVEPIWAYTNVANRVTDGANYMAAISKTLVDGAAPILVSSDPTDGYVGYSRLGNITLTFSEAMKSSTINSTNITGLPTMGTPSFTPDANNVVVTMDPSLTLVSFTAYTVTISTSVTDNAATPNAIVSTHFHFTSSSGTSAPAASAQTSTTTTPTITLSDPTDDEEVTAGAATTVVWTISGLGVDTVGLYYSIDAGVTYTEAAYNLDDASVSYSWTVPATLSGDVIFKVSAYDAGKAVLATDTVDISVTAVSSNEEEVGETTGETTENTTTDEEGRVVAESSGASGPSPVTGETEEISTVTTGWYIRSYSFDTVYYVDAAGRHSFWNTNAFFTYADSFDDVVWVTDATLPTMTLGSPMLPQAGTVLVKIQSDPKVYAIDSGNVLRWVPDETTAATLYGAAWADYVIDLEPTTFAYFTVGDDMSVNDTVDTDIMKTRLGLAELAQ